ncbi:MAG: hypothetical protein HC933_11290 [Pleurocapsa sp. SU_196_0]|nr:hypothetical protein [Pleurocapsa sp. SU_196_0]
MKQLIIISVLLLCLTACTTAKPVKYFFVTAVITNPLESPCTLGLEVAVSKNPSLLSLSPRVIVEPGQTATPDFTFNDLTAEGVPFLQATCLRTEGNGVARLNLEPRDHVIRVSGLRGTEHELVFPGPTITVVR